jgi:hypothetical protein
MIDHISLRLTDLAGALAFYRAALASLGYKVMLEFPDAVGMGDGRKAGQQHRGRLPRRRAGPRASAGAERQSRLRCAPEQGGAAPRTSPRRAD